MKPLGHAPVTQEEWDEQTHKNIINMADKKTENLCKEIQNSDLCRKCTNCEELYNGKVIKFDENGRCVECGKPRFSNIAQDSHNTDIEEVAEELCLLAIECTGREPTADFENDFKPLLRNWLTTYRTTILKEVEEYHKKQIKLQDHFLTEYEQAPFDWHKGRKIEAEEALEFVTALITNNQRKG